LGKGGGRELGAGLVDQAGRQGVFVTVDPEEQQHVDRLLSTTAGAGGGGAQACVGVEARFSEAIPPDPDALEGALNRQASYRAAFARATPKGVEHDRACAASTTQRVKHACICCERAQSRQTVAHENLAASASSAVKRSTER
jgi:hypothetical protein